MNMETLNKLFLELSTVVSPETKTARELAFEAENSRLSQKANDLASDMAALQRSSDERIGELNLALAAQKAQLAHLERTKTLSIKLVEALEATHACESFKNVWSLAQVHGVEYKGPTYKKELAELKKEVFA